MDDATPPGNTPHQVRWQTPLVWETATASWIPPERLDELLDLGWRHFGRQFHRYSFWLDPDGLKSVQPVRVDLARFTPSKSQRRLLRRNADLEVAFAPAVLDDERHALFERHKARFKSNIPETLLNFLGDRLEDYPCPMVELTARLQGRLVAASYLDLGTRSVSSVYAMFEPAESGRGLGIATLLWEMEWARARGIRHHHSGYAFHEPSMMDYKKRFKGLEWFDWQGRWIPQNPEKQDCPETAD